MNWRQGFKRLWYFMLGLIGIIWLGSAAKHGPAEFGEQLVYFAVFAVCWQLFGLAIAWVFAGFSKPEQKPGGPN